MTDWNPARPEFGPANQPDEQPEGPTSPSSSTPSSSSPPPAYAPPPAHTAPPTYTPPPAYAPPPAPSAGYRVASSTNDTQVYAAPLANRSDWQPPSWEP